MADTCNKLTELAAFAECEVDDIDIIGEDVFEADGAEYLVYTGAEADDACAECIRDSLWAFNASFLSGETGS